MEVRYQLRYSPVNRIIWSRWTATAYRLHLPVRTSQPRRANLACGMSRRGRLASACHGSRAKPLVHAAGPYGSAAADGGCPYY